MIKAIQWKVVGIMVFLFLSSKVKAQDVLLSTPDYGQLSINPGLAANSYRAAANVAYRGQGRGAELSYCTMMASGEYAFEGTRSNAGSYFATGVDLYQDNASSHQLSITMLRSSWAYHLQIDDFNQLSFGQYAGYLGESTNLNREKWGSQYNGKFYDAQLNSGEVFVTQQKNNIDVGSGLVFSNKKDLRMKDPYFQTGLAVYHLNRPNTSFLQDSKDRLPMRFSAFANFCFPVGAGGHLLKPATYLELQNRFLTGLAGATVDWRFNQKAYIHSGEKQGERVVLSTGLFFRSAGMLVARVALQKSFWSIGWTYDLSVVPAKIGGANNQASELLLRFMLQNKKRR